MKAKIVKVEYLADGSLAFNVYAEDNVVKCFHYKENVPPTDIYNEQKNYNAAMDLVKKIESQNSLRIEETIYETETLDKKDDISNVL